MVTRYDQINSIDQKVITMGYVKWKKLTNKERTM